MTNDKLLSKYSKFCIFGVRLTIHIKGGGGGYIIAGDVNISVKEKEETRMDKLGEDIRTFVKEHTEKGKEIYLKVLKELFGTRVSMPTLLRRVRRLVKDGYLTERLVTVGQGTRKYLGIP